MNVGKPTMYYYYYSPHLLNLTSSKTSNPQPHKINLSKRNCRESTQKTKTTNS